MTDPQLQAALRAGADGLYALEAGTGMILAHGTWPAREDFRCFVHVADSITDPGEKRMLRLAASLAGDVPVQLGNAVTGIDDRNVDLLVAAILHASGRRQFPR